MVLIRRSISAAVICLLSLFLLSAGAAETRAYETISAGIPVSCLEYTDDKSGTYRILINAVDDVSPQPLSDVLDITEEGIGTFSININEPGTFKYRVYQEEGSVPGVLYDSSVYVVTVFVEHTEDDSLAWGVSTIVEGKDSKPEKLEFQNTSATPRKTVTSTTVTETAVTTTTVTTSPEVTSLTETSSETTEPVSSTTTTVTTTGSIISEIIDTVLTGDTFPAHALRLTMLGAFLTAFTSILFRHRRDEEDEDDD